MPGTEELEQTQGTNAVRMVDGVIAYTGPVHSEGGDAAGSNAPARRFATAKPSTRVLGGQQLPGSVSSPIPEEEEGIRREFPTRGSEGGHDDDSAFHGDDEFFDEHPLIEEEEEFEDHEPPPPPPPKKNAEPTAPRRRRSGGGAGGGRGNGGSTRGKDPNRETAYERAKAHLSEERQQQLDDLRAEWGEGKDSIIFKIVEALTFSEQFFVNIPQQLRDSVREVVEQAVFRIAESLATIDVEQLSDKIADTTISRLWTRFNTRTVWEVVSAGSFVLFALGFVCALALTNGYYREQYEKHLSAIPHISNEMRTATGHRLMELTNINSDFPISLITNCDARAGLHMVQAQYGGKVCVGSTDATSGWRVKE